MSINKKRDGVLSYTVLMLNINHHWHNKVWFFTKTHGAARKNVTLSTPRWWIFCVVCHKPATFSVLLLVPRAAPPAYNRAPTPRSWNNISRHGTPEGSLSIQTQRGAGLSLDCSEPPEQRVFTKKKKLALSQARNFALRWLATSLKRDNCVVTIAFFAKLHQRHPPGSGKRGIELFSVCKPQTCIHVRV